MSGEPGPHLQLYERRALDGGRDAFGGLFDLGERNRADGLRIHGIFLDVHGEKLGTRGTLRG